MFDTASQAWEHIIQLLLHHGYPMESRDGDCVEVLANQLILTDPADCWAATRNPNFRYACGELFWYLSGSNSLEQITHYAKGYRKYSDDNRVLNGAYGPSIRYGIVEVVGMLKRDPDSRRVVLPIYNMTNLNQESKDIPCSLSLQFLARANGLNMVTTMRSNDAWLGFPYDLFCFATIQCIVASYAELDLGTYVHQVGSLHLYDRNRENVAMTEPGDTRLIPMEDLSDRDILQDLELACALERDLRFGVDIDLDEYDLPEIWRFLLEGVQ